MHCQPNPRTKVSHVQLSYIYQDCQKLRKHLIGQPNELVSDLAPPLGAYYLTMQYQKGARKGMRLIAPPGIWVKTGPAFLGPWLPLNIPKDFFVY